MKKRYLILLAAIASFKGYSQTPAAPAPSANDYSVSWYGFLRSDYIFDSRKSTMAREDQLNLYPNDVLRDANGKDANAVGQSNFLAVTSRFGAKVKGPDVWGAKMGGTLEADFYATVEANIGSLRLRHAFITMDWKKTSLTMGQTWYPTFIPEVFPGVANFNTGILFNPFGWATQVKLKQALSKDVSLSLTAYKEREFSVAGTTANAATINSTLPTLNAQLQYKGKNVFLGAGVEYKSVQPNTIFSNVVTTETLNSTSIFGYGKYTDDNIIIKAYGISGGNMNNLVMLGGYTSSVTGAGTTNAIQKFDPTRTTAFWIDIASAGKSVAPGIFFGTTKNHGANEAGTLLNPSLTYDSTNNPFGISGRGLAKARSIDNVWRLSGRIDFKKNKFRVSPELELTSAKWGDTNLFGKAASNFETVNNFRTMISCVYTF
jgi:hypothetical protein